MCTRTVISEKKKEKRFSPCFPISERPAASTVFPNLALRVKSLLAPGLDSYLVCIWLQVYILLSRESDQCAIRAHLGDAGHLSVTTRRELPATCLPHNGTTSNLAGLFITLSLQC